MYKHLLDLHYLSLDEALDTLAITHREFRTWCHCNKHPMPPISRNLAFETQTEERKDVIDKWHVTHAEANRLLYTTLPTTNQLVNLLRRDNVTEQELYEITGETTYYNQQTLSEEMQVHRNNGLACQDIGRMYGLSYSRVSQLTKSSTTRRRLTAHEKEEIRRSLDSPAELARAYSTTVNTIYVVRR